MFARTDRPGCIGGCATIAANKRKRNRCVRAASGLTRYVRANPNTLQNGNSWITAQTSSRLCLNCRLDAVTSYNVRN